MPWDTRHYGAGQSMLPAPSVDARCWFKEPRAPSASALFAWHAEWARVSSARFDHPPMKPRRGKPALTMSLSTIAIFSLR